MNIDRLTQELIKKEERLIRLQEEVAQLRKRKQEEENLRIIALVRECEATPDELAGLLESLRKQPFSAPQETAEQSPEQ